jgi:hypothetical protein
MVLGASLLKQEEHAAFVLFLAFLLVLFWYAIWGLTDEFVEEVQRRYGVSKGRVYAGILAAVLLFIVAFPQMLQKL